MTEIIEITNKADKYKEQLEALQIWVKKLIDENMCQLTCEYLQTMNHKCAHRSIYFEFPLFSMQLKGKRIKTIKRKKTKKCIKVEMITIKFF